MRAKRILFLAAVALLGGPLALPNSSSYARAGDTEKSSIESGTRAKPIKRANPQYPTEESQRGIEGWVQVSFVVNPDGSVGETLIEDSSGRKNFEKETLKAIQRWRYEPATMNGEPIEQCHTKVRIAYSLDQPSRKRGARKHFKNDFKKANKLLEEGKLEEADIAIGEIEEKWVTTLYESSRLWILRAMLQEKQGDELGQLESLTRSISGDGEYVEPIIYAGAMLRILDLELKFQRYADALLTIEKLEGMDLDDDVAAKIANTKQEIEKLKTSDRAVAIAGEVGEAREEYHGAGMWWHTLLRRTAGIEAVSGSLERVELRCDWRRVKAKPETGRAWRIPPDWGDCSIYVFGEPGSTFQLLEYAPIPS